MERYSNLFLLALIMVSLSHCSSAQKLQKEAPFNIKQAYYQSWVAGIQGGGSGVELYIEIDSDTNKKIEFDSVYFRGNVSKLSITPDNSNMLKGKFSTITNQKRDIVMSNKPNAEYGNIPPTRKQIFPFQLKDNQCVISYKEKNKTKYFKVDGIKQKQTLYYPSTPPKKQ